MSLNFIDVEYLITFLLLICCLIGGSKRRACKIEVKSWSLLAVDKTTSDVMKAIACVFVLMGHWATNLLNSGESLGIVAKVSWHTTANIALCWFMYFSGYGLSLKDNDCNAIGIDWWKRVKKIYLPLFVVSLSSIIVCMVLPDIGLEKTWANFNKNVHLIHSFEISKLSSLLMSAFGLFDWYVSCILIFYSIYYLTLNFSRKLKVNHTIILATGMLLYNVIAYFVFGWEQAHYFRFPWIFMLGHLVAVYKRNHIIVNILTISVFIPTILIHDKVTITCFVLAVIGISFFAVIGKRFYFGGGVLLFLGSISYFFYLSHIRIGYTLLAYTNIHSMIFWIIITFIVSIIFKAFRLNG